MRVVIDGADLLFTRGAEGRSLNGVMLLSTYPLLGSEQDWTASLLHGRNTAWRVFGEDTAEGLYIAARGLFRDAGSGVPIHDYGPPAWLLDGNLRGAPGEPPATWLTVIGQRRFWPIAVLHDPSVAGQESDLEPPSQRGDRPLFPDGEVNPLRMPTAIWLFLTAYLLGSLIHTHLCRHGHALRRSLGAFSYFAPLPGPQHPFLIALGSLLIAVIAVTVAANSGLFAWSFADPWTGIFLAALLLAAMALSFLACIGNFSLAPVCISPAETGGTARWRTAAGVAGLIGLAGFVFLHGHLLSGLTSGNRFPLFLRSVNLTSGVSPLTPQLLLLAGGYCWFWFTLRGLAHFGGDRPRLPLEEASPRLTMFSWERAGRPVEEAAHPLSGRYLALLFFVLFPIAAFICCVALQDISIRTLGERRYGILIFWWICLYIAVILADGIQVWRIWTKHRRLLVHLDGLPLRRTLRALKGLEGSSIWSMSGNVIQQRYRMVWLQLEALRNITNSTKTELCSQKTGPHAGVPASSDKCLAAIEDCRVKAGGFIRWYEDFSSKQPENQIPEFQSTIAKTAGMLMTDMLLPAWGEETVSLASQHSDPGEQTGSEQESKSYEGVPLHVRAAEEFVVLVYAAFIQNILGRMRSLALGSLGLFVAATLAISSYPFEPLGVLGGIFLAVFLICGAIVIVVYAQMSRDATLSHITNTTPGSLGGEFWKKLVSIGIAPLLALLTTLFPSIGDFVISWIQPGAQALK
jgi:hypothetical protein